MEFISDLKLVFFPEVEHGSFCLSNASGIPFQINDADEWEVQQCVKTHGPLSKLSVYLMHQLTTVRLSLKSFRL